MINLRNILRGVKDPSLLPVFLRRICPLTALRHDPECSHLIKSWSSGSLPRRSLVEVFKGIEQCDVELRMPYDRIVGWSVDIQELVCILSVMRLIGAKRVLEIGTYDGFVALNLAANMCDGGTVCTVDLPPRGTHERGMRERITNACDPAIVGLKFRDEKEAAKIQQVLDDSTVLDWSDLGGPFDLIFIDGCHDHYYVRKDTENAFHQLSPGGVIIWHDYGQVPDVSRVVDMWAESVGIVAIKGTRLALYFDVWRSSGRSRVLECEGPAARPPEAKWLRRTVGVHGTSRGVDSSGKPQSVSTYLWPPRVGRHSNRASEK